MSNKEYDANCKSLKKVCKLSIECSAHSSLNNLKVISKNLKTILAQSELLSKDWDKQKKVHSGKYGYLSMAVNYPEILYQTKLIKRLVRSFNNGREKVIKYRDTILSYHKVKPDFLKMKTSFRDTKRAKSSKNKLISRLIK